MLLTIDPGITTGWAVWDGQLLVRCGKHAPDSWSQGITHAVLEHPVIYPHGRTRNPNDIVKLAVTTGELAGILKARGVSVRYVEPRAWKGSLDKHVCCRRVWSRLAPTEQVVAAPYRPEASGPVKGGKDHVLDAIGLGLHVIGRLRD